MSRRLLAQAQCPKQGPSPNLVRRLGICSVSQGEQCSMFLFRHSTLVLRVCVCVCAHSHVHMGQRCQLGTRITKASWNPTLFLCLKASHSQEFFQSPSAGKYFTKPYYSNLDYAVGSLCMLSPSHCFVDYCAAITSYGNLALLYFSSQVYSSASTDNLVNECLPFYFSSPLSLKFLLLDSIWTTVRVRIETKQKSITSLSDVDFQIGEDSWD